MRSVLLGAAGLAATVVAVALSLAGIADDDDTPGDARTPIAVLGDSDSHAYHDDIRLTKPGVRGGEHRATTYQWTEVLAKLRGNELDLGRWGAWGTRPKLARLIGALGRQSRAPRRRDFRHVFALSGAECPDLTEGHYRQVEPLLRLMRDSHDRWERGVIVIRIGANDIGRTEDLERYAATGLDEAARRAVAACTEAYRRTIAMIRAEHPRTAIVVVSTSDDRDLPANHERWRDAAATGRIGAVLALHEKELQSLCAADSACAFWNDREWFQRYWGARDDSGMPAYRAVRLGGPTAVENTQGDHPRNAVLADNHAGAVFNALWARDLATLLRERFSIRVAPLADAEIAQLLDPRGEFGLGPR